MKYILKYSDKNRYVRVNNSSFDGEPNFSQATRFDSVWKILKACGERGARYLSIVHDNKTWEYLEIVCVDE